MVTSTPYRMSNGDDHARAGMVKRRDTDDVGFWPLVGRTGELRQLQRLLAAETARGIVLAGPAGVGKTRLATEALDLAARARYATIRVTATRSAAGLPLGAFSALLPPRDHAPGMVDDRTELLRRCADALAKTADGRRLAILVDDAHLLDEASATLVYQLVAHHGSFVLATVRTGQAAPDAIMALWKDGLLDRLELGGLPTKTVGELLAAVLEGPVDPSTSARLAVRCQGNVLFLRELVLGALADGTLRDDGIWRLVGPSPPSERLAELVDARLEGLSGEERTLLEVVSFADSLGQAEYLAFADPPVAETLERKGLLTSETDGRRLQMRLAHPLYGEVVRARLPAVRAREVARRLAEVTTASGARRRDDTLRVATWRLEGGGADPDVMLAAATTARWRYDFALAERLARAAVEAGAGFEAAFLLAQLTSLQGHGVEADAQLGALAARARDDRQAGRVAVARVDNLAIYLGRIDEGIRIAEDAEAAMTDQAWRDEIAAKRSLLLLGTEGPRRAMEVVEPLLDRARGRALAWVGQVGAFSLARQGRLTAAVEVAERGRAAHLALTEPLDWYPWTYIFCRVEALAHGGRFAEARALATEQYQRGVAEGSSEAQAWFAWQLGKMVGDCGHVHTAAVHLREAIALFRQLGRPLFVELCLTYLTLALALGGKSEEATESLSSLDSLDLPPSFYLRTDLVQARAWVAVAAGDLPRGREVLTEAAALGERIGDRVGEAAALHGLARLGHAKEVVCRLGVLAEEMEGGLAVARAAHTRALAERDPVALSEVAPVFEAMEADLLAAEAWADAAVAWRRAGNPRPREMAAAERQAAGLVDRCGGVVTPALLAIEVRVRLTPAERETALLAAGGRSNREIAEELVLSVRTVEDRLQRIYQKLGVSGRSELADAVQSV